VRRYGSHLISRLGHDKLTTRANSTATVNFKVDRFGHVNSHSTSNSRRQHLQNTPGLHRWKHARYVQPHVPMTLHNLDSHISWLLQSRPTVVSCGAPSHLSTAVATTLQKGRPDVSIRETNTTHFERQGPRFDSQLLANSTRNPVDVDPTPNSNQECALIETTRKLEQSNMARLASAPRTSRATLLYNQQTPLAAPGPTTPSSIAVAYAASFHKDGM
jgi:hypothetical protein